MTHRREPDREIHRRGQALYDARIRAAVETPENIGKLIAIAIETGDYAIADDGVSARRSLVARHPGAVLFGARIGYDTAYAFGGTLRRTAPP